MLKVIRTKRKGITKHPAYNSWAAMKQGCRDPKSSAWQTMGAHGATFPPAWKSFSTFLVDMGEPPEGYTLARKIPRGPFNIYNCVWAPKHNHYVGGEINPKHVPAAALTRLGTIEHPPKFFVVFKTSTGGTRAVGPFDSQQDAKLAGPQYAKQFSVGALYHPQDPSNFEMDVETLTKV